MPHMEDLCLLLVLEAQKYEQKYLEEWMRFIYITQVVFLSKRFQFSCMQPGLEARKKFALQKRNMGLEWNL